METNNNTLDPNESRLLYPADIPSAVTLAYKRIARFTEVELQHPAELYTFRVNILILSKYQHLISAILNPTALLSVHMKLSSLNFESIPDKAQEEVKNLTKFLRLTLGIREP